MSNYAKKAFNGGIIQSIATNATNPVNVPIQTAFVGFGSDFSDLGSSDVINACKLTSRTQSDRTGHDSCSLIKRQMLSQVQVMEMADFLLRKQHKV